MHVGLELERGQQDAGLHEGDLPRSSGETCVDLAPRLLREVQRAELATLSVALGEERRVG